MNDQQAKSGYAEYKVRPVTRYVVTRFKDDGISASSSQLGEFDNVGAANRVAMALAGAEKDSIVSLHGAGDPVSGSAV